MAKTIREQIASIDAQVAKLAAKKVELEAKVGNEVDTTLIVAGATVDFNYGKSPNLRALTGQVVAVKPNEPGQKGGTLVKIAVGEGFDAQLVVVFPSAVTKVHAAAVSADEALNSAAE